MGPNGLVGALWRRRLLAFVVLVAVLAVSLVVGVRTPRSYTSVGVLEVGRSGGSPADLDAVARTARSSDVVDAVQRGLADEAGVSRSAGSVRDAVEAAPTADGVGLRLGVSDAEPEVAALAARLLMDAVQVRGPESASVAYTVADVPGVPTTSSRPLLGPVVLAGLVLGLLLALAVAVLRDRRVATVDDAGAAEDLVGAPLLGHVWLGAELTDLPALQPGTAGSDDFARLGEAVRAQADGDLSGVVVVAGLGALETHVWVGANLAVDLARRGREVLLLDGRLSCPPGPDGPEGPGLSEVLDGTALDEALVAGPVPGLTVLPARGSAGTPVSAAAASSPASPASPASPSSSGSPVSSPVATAPDRRDIRPVLAEARRRFDVVVVLPPPAQTSDRAYATGASVLLVVPLGTVRATALRRHADDARASGARLLGTVLVGRPTHGGRDV